MNGVDEMMSNVSGFDVCRGGQKVRFHNGDCKKTDDEKGDIRTDGMDRSAVPGLYTAGEAA